MKQGSRRFTAVLITLAASLVAACGASSTPAGSQPAAAVITGHEQYAAGVAGVTFSGDFSEVISVKAFAAGAWTPAHSDGGTGLATVLTGRLTFRSGGVDRVVAAGASFSVQPGQVHQVGNEGTDVAELMVVQLIPAGARESMPAPGAMMPAALPTTLYTARLDGLHYPGAFNLGTSVVDFPAGAWNPKHEADGFVLLLVVAGQIESRIGGADALHYPGDLIRIDVGTMHQIGNPGQAPARVLMVGLQPAS